MNNKDLFDWLFDLIWLSHWTDKLNKQSIILLNKHITQPTNQPVAWNLWGQKQCSHMVELPEDSVTGTIKIASFLLF